MYSFKFENFVDELVKKVNETSLNGFYKPYNIRIKDDGSIVTDVDILVEKNIREILSNYFPEDSIFGEELGFTKGNSSRVWIIDPIDGTTAFSQRRPEWGTLIASYENTILDTGIVICPIQDIYVAVMKNKLIRATFDHTLDISSSKKISVMIEKNINVEKSISNFEFSKLHTHITKQQFCKDIISLGFSDFDAIVFYAPFPHDRLPYEPILKEIGGTISDLEGNEIDLIKEDVVCLATKSEEVKRIIVKNQNFQKEEIKDRLTT